MYHPSPSVPQPQANKGCVIPTRYHLLSLLLLSLSSVTLASGQIFATYCLDLLDGSTTQPPAQSKGLVSRPVRWQLPIHKTAQHTDLTSRHHSKKYQLPTFFPRHIKKPSIKVQSKDRRLQNPEAIAMNITKKFDRAFQWAGEKMGTESRTVMSEEFKMLEAEMALRFDGTKPFPTPPATLFRS